MRKQLLIPIACVALFVGLISLTTRSTPQSTKQSPQTQTAQPAPAPAAAATRRDVRPDRRARPELRASDPALSSSAPPAPRDADPLASIEPAKRPLILAIRDSGKGPAAKRRAMLQALEDSGESSGGWTPRAQQVFENWRAQLPDEFRNRISLRDVRCFRAGCAVDITFDSEDEYRRAASLFPRLKESGMPHGGRVQTPIEPGAGVYGTASWIMLSPTEEQLEAAKGV